MPAFVSYATSPLSNVNTFAYATPRCQRFMNGRWIGASVLFYIFMSCLLSFAGWLNSSISGYNRCAYKIFVFSVFVCQAILFLSYFWIFYDKIFKCSTQKSFDSEFLVWIIFGDWNFVSEENYNFLFINIRCNCIYSLRIFFSRMRFLKKKKIIIFLIDFFFFL